MEFDIVIVGGGLAGASLAVALRQSSRRIAVVEGSAPLRPQGWDRRIYAISPINQAFLEHIGVWQHLDRSRLNPVVEMSVLGDADGQLAFSAYDAGLGELAWIAESSLLQMELWETLKRQHNVTVFCPGRPVSLSMDDSCAQLGLHDGSRLRSRLIVGADGANSWVRQHSGIEAQLVPYDELGVVANFRCSKPHRDTAYQWFREGTVLAWLPLPGDRISIVWSAPTAQAKELLSMDRAEFAEVVAAAGERRLGELELESEPLGFPLRLMRVGEVVRHRLALVGDAAHAIHPLSGHGINLGFQDVRALAERLLALPDWRDPGELHVLRAYARERAEEPLLVQYTTHALNRLFKMRDPVTCAIRNVGMNLTERVPVLKSALIRYAVSGKF
jgi:ubiquinone biosynthesis UbiH/UbiF/VisC/COQ6 family hydroxylase